MSGTPIGYHYPGEFPREAFVQQAIAAHFTALGFQTETGGYSDLVCHSVERGERWVIEAKGQTGAVGLDFRTGLGQVLQAMGDPSYLYGVAVPNTPQFIAQCRKVSEWVRSALRLHWLLVESDGSVTVIKPEESLP